MKTASIEISHVYGTKAGMWINATYRSKTVSSISCHDSEEIPQVAVIKVRLKNMGYTHYREFGIGPLRKL